MPAITSTRRCAGSKVGGEDMSDELPPHMRPQRSFQGLILGLQRYWADHGCMILQPYDMEVGAGTFHPATTLRALGPRPWNAAYVQPSRRPKDGRYGENPNRLQHYYQFQVILKPSPRDMQELYLQSLYAIGIDPGIHDIRFVEDDWESPTLAAWVMEGNARRHRMALPAYDQCIKASHIFNLLDARGVISVTERQSFILRVRELAKACGAAWLATDGGGANAASELSTGKNTAR